MIKAMIRRFTSLDHPLEEATVVFVTEKEKNRLLALSTCIIVLCLSNIAFAWTSYWGAFGWFSSAIVIGGASWIIHIFERLKSTTALGGQVPTTTTTTTDNMNKLNSSLITPVRMALDFTAISSMLHPAGFISIVASFFAFGQGIVNLLEEEAVIPSLPYWSPVPPVIWGGLAIVSGILYFSSGVVSIVLASDLELALYNAREQSFRGANNNNNNKTDTTTNDDVQAA
jgi:hypothetical protein